MGLSELRILFLLPLAALACSRASPPPPAALGVEAEVHVRSKDPGTTCVLSGSFHVPHAESRRISGGTDWTGTVTVGEGDLVVVTAGVVGTETWACEIECAVRQTGAKVMTTHKSEAIASRPAPTCPIGHSAEATCVLKAENPKR